MSNPDSDEAKKIVRTRRPRKCPNCGHSPVGTILWGMPDFSIKLQASMESGEVIIGGCCCGIDDPTWECSKCNQQIWKRSGNVSE